MSDQYNYNIVLRVEGRPETGFDEALKELDNVPGEMTLKDIIPYDDGSGYEVYLASRIPLEDTDDVEGFRSDYEEMLFGDDEGRITVDSTSVAEDER